MIHPQAIVEPGAKLADDVEVGPWSYIGADVEIGAGCRIGPHAVIKGPTKMGKNNRVFQFSSIGEDCQDKKYQGEPTELLIGDDNVFREGCTIHRGTVQDNSITIIGSDNLFMANAHVAHDCVVGSHNIIANNAALAGHVHLGDYIILGALRRCISFVTLARTVCVVQELLFCRMSLRLLCVTVIQLSPMELTRWDCAVKATVMTLSVRLNGPTG